MKDAILYLDRHGNLSQVPPTLHEAKCHGQGRIMDSYHVDRTLNSSW